MRCKKRKKVIIIKQKTISKILAAAIVVTGIMPGTAFAAPNNYSYTINQVGQNVQQHMVNRETNFNVTFNLPKDSINHNVINDIYNATFSEDNAISYKANDYLYYTYDKFGIDGTVDQNTNRYDLKFTIKYYDTKEQESYVDAKINSIIDSLHLNGKTEYQKISLINNYVTKNVSYDHSKTIPKISYSAYGALHNKKAVCQGYCNLTYLLCKKAGIYVKTLNSDSHSWNVVKISGKYYLIDTTWNAANKNKYFLTCEKHGNCQKYNKNDLKNKEFYNKHKISNNCYGKNCKTIKATAKLNKTSFTYNGKIQTPVVTVKSSTGKTLKRGKDFTISYGGNCKTPGKHKVVINYKNNYTGTKNYYFYIIPKGTSIKSLSKGKKKIYLKVNKQTAQIDGYQVQYSTSSKFKSGNKTTCINKKKTTKTIKKLKSKKWYYVRVRTYKQVTVDGKKQWYYSNWSNTKSIKIK